MSWFLSRNYLHDFYPFSWPFLSESGLHIEYLHTCLRCTLRSCSGQSVVWSPSLINGTVEQWRRAITVVGGGCVAPQLLKHSHISYLYCRASN